MNRNLIEFEFEGEIIAQVESRLTPREGEKVSIKGRDYTVTSIHWVVSNSENFRWTELGAIVYLERIKDDDKG